MEPIRTIVVAFDFSEHATAALTLAAELARTLGARLRLLHVVEPPAYAYTGEQYLGGPVQDLVEEAERQLHEVASHLAFPDEDIEVRVAEGTSVAEIIDAQAARLGADLVIMGTHGRTGLSRALHGSVAERTLRYAPCPVLTVPIPKPEAHRHRARSAPPVPW